jgi:hypothetical protein
VVKLISDVRALPFLKIGPPIELPGALRGFLSGALLDTGSRNRGERNQLYDVLVDDAKDKTEKMLAEGSSFNVFKSVMSTGMTVRNPQVDLSSEILELVFPRPNWPLLLRESKKLIFGTEQEVMIWFNGTKKEGVPSAGSEYCYIRDTVCKRLTYADCGAEDRGEMRTVRGDQLVYFVQTIDADETLVDEIGEAIGELL